MKEFVEKHDKKIHRVLEMIPRIVNLECSFISGLDGYLIPEIIVYILIALTVYWLYMAVRHVFGMIKGYNIYKEEIEQDWYKKCQELDFAKLPDQDQIPSNLSRLKHFILIPAVNEPYEVLKPAFESYYKQTFPKDQMVLVYTLEEKYSQETIATLKRIFNGREDEFSDILIYVHPAGIPGEAVGAGAANRTWGAKHAVEDLREKGENLRNFVFSTFDADHVLNEKFISRLSHLYLSCEERDNRFYQSALALFDNNYWDVPIFMRIEATSVALGGLAEWSVKGKLKDTFAAYSASLQTLLDANYWDVSLGVDDQIFYWRAFFKRKGYFVGVPHYIPYSADAVKGKDFVDSCRSLYKQLVRWGWGVIDFPLSVKGFMKKGDIPLRLKLAWMFRHLEKGVLLIDSVFLITFGFGILTFANPNVKQATFAYSLPNIMSIILTIPLIFFLPITIIRFKLVKPMPEEWSFWRKLVAVLESPFVIINMLSFSFLPHIEAQTRMFLGKKMKDLYHTPKIR